MTQAVLRAHDLAHAYPNGTAVFQAVSLDVKAREIVCLLGGSGCGKSTLLRALAGLSKPLRGQVEFLEAPLNEPHPRAALLFQQPSLLPWLDVARNVGFGLNFTHQPTLPREQLQARVATALDAVGLGGQHRLRPAQLSGGMAQRVALARALAREPQLLLADEPFSALDAITRAQMQTLLVELVHRWHTAALLVTHDIDEAILVADRILLMGAPAPGEPAQLLREWTVSIERPREAAPAEVTAMRLDILQALHAQQTLPV
ncbi:ABC transporter ATP-binding protein [Hydrogenophaga sp.]|uniref:ABC transporter ATP-binding protein n=1 Tax=Hydrogenophaga sp. TaxID=1904254 RepID=UPI003F721756